MSLEKGIVTAFTELVTDIVSLVTGPILYVISYVVAVIFVPISFIDNLFDGNTP
jgi:hypothetical protein